MSQLEDLKELKRIIVGDNADELGRIRDRLQDTESRTSDVAEVLAPAINKGIAEDPRLSAAFEKPVADGLTKAVQNDPETIANALYPVMAPAIRRAISESISSLLVTINQTIESATTVGGMRTRFESFRTGIPYAELTLRKSLVYRVEQVFLIDRSSGLLISDLANDAVETLDSDGVSAMFSAIQSFVQDSFSQNEEDRLTDLTVGDHNIWVVHGPKAMLACVIRGEAPASLKTQLHDSLDAIRRDFAAPLSNFEGDLAQFVGVEEYLRPCLQLELRHAEAEKKSSVSTILALLLVSALILFFAYQYVANTIKLKDAREVLDHTPGLVVTNSSWDDGKLRVVGLLDPVAKLPTSELQELGIEQDDIVLLTKPFQSLETEIIAERFRQRHQLPDSIGVVYQEIEGNNTIMLDGAADGNWLIDHYDSLALFSDISSIDTSSLDIDEESIKTILRREVFDTPEGKSIEFELNKLESSYQILGDFPASVERDIRRLNQRLPWLEVEIQYQINIKEYMAKLNLDNIIEFTSGITPELESAKRLDALLNEMLELQTKTDPSKQFTVIIQGHTDGPSQTLANQTLRKQRAEFLYSKFIEHGLATERFDFQIVDKFDSMLKVRSVEYHISYLP